MHAVLHTRSQQNLSHAASQLITTLLKDVVMVHCKQDVKTEDYHTHAYSTSPTKGEVKMAADTSPEKCITISILEAQYTLTQINIITLPPPPPA